MIRSRSLVARCLQRRVVAFRPDTEIEQDGKRNQNGRREADGQRPFRSVIHVEWRSSLNGFASFADDDAVELRRWLELVQWSHALVYRRAPFEIRLELIILFRVAHGPRS
jgi:hypothetical protein